MQWNRWAANFFSFFPFLICNKKKIQRNPNHTTKLFNENEGNENYAIDCNKHQAIDCICMYITSTNQNLMCARHKEKTKKKKCSIRLDKDRMTSVLWWLHVFIFIFEYIYISLSTKTNNSHIFFFLFWFLNMCIYV